MSRRPDPKTLAERLARGDRAALGRAITLVESRRPRHRRQAQELLQCLPPTALGAEAVRLGISGPPGVGKSSFIEVLGMDLVEDGLRVAVLAVDPSSERTGGSILADKTRMGRLSMHGSAFVRPSPSSGALGGVGRRTRETMLLCEAAGYDVVIVETVGVGQSETEVAMMVDTFLLLMLAGAGDEVQGIKRGVLEWADLLAVTKADGDNRVPAGRAAGELRSALSIFIPPSAPWQPPVLTVSALEDEGVRALWDEVQRHRREARADGRFEARRRDQRRYWLHASIRNALEDAFEHHPEVRALRSEIEAQVEAGTLTPVSGALRLLAAFGVDGEAHL